LHTFGRPGADAAVWREHVLAGPYSPERSAAWWMPTPPQIFEAARWALGKIRQVRNRRLSGF
jgi:hypothetical protein